MIETNFFSTFFLPGTLALIMMGMGLTLTMTDFKNIFFAPRAVLTGLVAQMLLLPAIAFVIAFCCGLPPVIQVGIILTAATPGGASSNLINYLLKGNLALSVSLTAINSFLTTISIPLFANLALWAFMGDGKDITMPFWETVIHILLITVIPTVIGILIRHNWPGLAERLEKPLKALMPIMLGLAMVAVIFLEKKEVGSPGLHDFLVVFPWMLLLNFFALFGGFFAGKVMALGMANQVTIGVEVGLHNSGLAIAIATSQYMLNNQQMAIPASVYALFSFFTAILFGLLVNRKNVRIRDMFR